MDLGLNLNLDLSLLPILLLANPSPTTGLTPLHTAAALFSGEALSPSSPWGMLLDTFRFCLGMQTGLSPAALNQAEFPACAAMTTGYVFRVENQATVMYLQKIGRTGHLTTLDVHPPHLHPPPPPPSASAAAAGGPGPGPRKTGVRRVSVSSMPVLALVTVTSLPLFASQTTRASPALVATLLTLILSRVLSIVSLRARTPSSSWHGASEPGVKGDLLILLSEDRWIRMTGLVDDLKAVTSGAWLSRPAHPALMGAVDWIARMLVYIAVVALGGATDGEKVMLVGAIVVSHLVLMYENSKVDELVMNERTVTVSSRPGSVKKYSRRLDMAEELVRETGRSDFAVRLGLINPDKVEASKKQTEKSGGAGQEVVTM